MSPLVERFWEKVHKAGKDECWLWTASTDREGYGDLSVRISGKRGHLRAHRYSWELANGPIPKGLCVLHDCDNPPCVNPRHLFLGTNLDNIKDRENKGRGSKGDRHYRAKLTSDQVTSIRTEHASGISQLTLAKKYGMGKTTIWAIVHHHTWKSK
jgi:hypothetical protein